MTRNVIQNIDGCSLTSKNIEGKARRKKKKKSQTVCVCVFILVSQSLTAEPPEWTGTCDTFVLVC